MFYFFISIRVKLLQELVALIAEKNIRKSAEYQSVSTNSDSDQLESLIVAQQIQKLNKYYKRDEQFQIKESEFINVSGELYPCLLPILDSQEELYVVRDCLEIIE